MSCSLFISDLHLAPSRQWVSRAFTDFLEAHQSRCEALYILGDLFEAWVGDDDDSELANEVRSALKQFTEAGPRLYLMQGNRDFLLGEDFCRQVGATLLQDPTVVDLYGTPTLLMHGDTLCSEDTEYLAFRTMTRNPAWQHQALSKSLSERRLLAAQLRQGSAEAMSNKAEDIMDATAVEVARVMAEAGVNSLIHGHTHRPQQHREPLGTRWVLGDWDRQAWFISASPDNISLHSYDINQ